MPLHFSSSILPTNPDQPCFSQFGCDLTSLTLTNLFLLLPTAHQTTPILSSSLTLQYPALHLPAM
ncbi:hypothetical protein E2C01_055177 [Portunus trituberculatus]|uniref:Uncharacterized protein n=1 Tax=Portunus trituberculatus TaxID=210409 RepID=A0A5B7GWY2_PORTR|nr:hypothetical protein [Portunus trituberculatus]